MWELRQDAAVYLICTNYQGWFETRLLCTNHYNISSSDGFRPRYASSSSSQALVLLLPVVRAAGVVEQGRNKWGAGFGGVGRIWRGYKEKEFPLVDYTSSPRPSPYSQPPVTPSLNFGQGNWSESTVNFFWITPSTLGIKSTPFHRVRDIPLSKTDGITVSLSSSPSCRDRCRQKPGKMSPFNIETCARPNILSLVPYRCARE